MGYCKRTPGFEGAYVSKVEQILFGGPREFIYEKTAGCCSGTGEPGRAAKGCGWVHTVPICEKGKKVDSANCRCQSWAKFLKGKLGTYKKGRK